MDADVFADRSSPRFKGCRHFDAAAVYCGRYFNGCQWLLLPESVSGSAVGMVNLGGQAAGFISPALIGFIITAFHGSYDAVFMFLIVAACCSAAVSLTIRHRSHNQLLS